MSITYTTDNNQYLPDGVTPNPNFGHVTQTGTEDTPITTPIVMEKPDFCDYCYAQLGAIAQPSGTAQQQLMAGITRYGQIILALKATTDPASAAAFDAYNVRNTCTLDKVTVFLGLIGPGGSSVITTPEQAAIIGNWKNA